MPTPTRESTIRKKVPKLLDWQRDLVRWMPPRDVRVGTTGILTAAWGTGKTFTGGARFAKIVMEHGGPDTVAICSAPTAKTLETTMPQAIMRYMPDDFIRKRGKPHGTPEWILQNGCRVVFWSGKGMIDSVDNCIALWVDEAQHQCYLDESKWGQLMGRLRGPAKYKELIVTGIAINDEVFRRRFEREDEDIYIALPGLEDSWAAKDDPSFIDRSIAGKPKHLEEVLRKGGWVPPQMVAFPHLVLDPRAEDSNVVTDDVTEYLTGDRPVYLSLDNGEQFGACVFAPVKASDGTDALLALQSWCFDRMDAFDVCDEIIKTTDFKIKRVFIDTDAPREVRRLVKQALGQVPIEDLKKGSREWRLEVKLERFQWAICDGNGVRRFFMHERMLKEGKRGLVKVLQSSEFKDDGRTLTKPNTEHVRDCAVYAVCCSLRPKKQVRPEDYGAI